jgi:hypothetical protein
MARCPKRPETQRTDGGDSANHPQLRRPTVLWHHSQATAMAGVRQVTGRPLRRRPLEAIIKVRQQLKRGNGSSPVHSRRPRHTSIVRETTPGDTADRDPEASDRCKLLHRSCVSGHPAAVATMAAPAVEAAADTWRALATAGRTAAVDRTVAADHMVAADRMLAADRMVAAAAGHTMAVVEAIVVGGAEADTTTADHSKQQSSSLRPVDQRIGSTGPFFWFSQTARPRISRHNIRYRKLPSTGKGLTSPTGLHHSCPATPNLQTTTAVADLR